MRKLIAFVAAALVAAVLVAAVGERWKAMGVLAAAEGELEQAEPPPEEPAGEEAEPAEPEGSAPEEGAAEEEGEDEEKPPVWERPRFEARRRERLRMVATQIERRDVEDEKVLDAMRQVPRHEFCHEFFRADAYADRPLPIGHGQTISQPYIVAYMTELLELKPGHKVLEIGTGSGYQAAVLTELTPHVFTIEIIEELAEQAAKRLKRLGYETADVRQGDGYYGWEEHAPFDAIIVTAAAGHIPPPLLEQLKETGRMVLPLKGAFAVERLVLLTRQDDRWRTRALGAVRFVPMTGRVQEGEPERPG